MGQCPCVSTRKDILLHKALTGISWLIWTSRSSDLPWNFIYTTNWNLKKQLANIIRWLSLYLVKTLHCLFIPQTESSSSEPSQSEGSNASASSPSSFPMWNEGAGGGKQILRRPLSLYLSHQRRQTSTNMGVSNLVRMVFWRRTLSQHSEPTLIQDLYVA